MGGLVIQSHNEVKDILYDLDALDIEKLFMNL